MDAIVLSFLYTLRIIAGGIVSEIEVSFWLLTFSFLLFFSLALSKRYSELANSPDSEHLKITRREYRGHDALLVLCLGIGSAFSAITLLALYINEQAERIIYQSPQFLYILIPVFIYCMSMFWLQTIRGKNSEDPMMALVMSRYLRIPIVLIIFSLMLARYL